MRDSSLVQPSWQKILASGFSSASSLLAFLNLPEEAAAFSAEQLFKTRVPRGFAERMEKGNPADPLLRQVLAIRDELHVSPMFEPDPLSERPQNRLPGLIHKYAGRVLLIVTGGCAVHCRYCFRRHFPYEDNNPGRQGWGPVLAYITEHSEFSEVILSGGDPLLANDDVLFSLISEIEKIATVKTLRLHSRIPIVLPERLDARFVDKLSQVKLKKVLVLHANHPNELNYAVVEGCQQLRRTGCLLLNQTVLLRGVNDSAETLAQLSHRLFELEVLPYYLHLLDKVSGAVHFDLPEKTALALFYQLQTLLPGYLVPKLVREEAGVGYKTIVA